MTGHSTTTNRVKTPRWTIRRRILMLLLAPLVPLLAMLVFATSVSLSPAVNLRNARDVSVSVGLPAASLITALQQERMESVIEVSTPLNPTVMSDLVNFRANTDGALGSLEKTLSAGAFRSAANKETLDQINVIRTEPDKLTAMREGVDRGDTRAVVMDNYNQAIQTTLNVYSAIDSLDDHSLAREANSLIGLAEAAEAMSQEYAWLAGPLATGVMDPADYANLVGAIATQRYLYSEATRFLNTADAQAYRQIEASAAYNRFRAMEDTLMSHPNLGQRPDVDPKQWQDDYAAVATALGGFEATIANNTLDDTAGAASSRETRLFVAVGASVVMLLILVFFSLRIARSLIRRVAALRIDALTLATDRLPSVISRLRTGETVDLRTESPPLDYGWDELGQLGAAFTQVQATAIGAAIQESNLRQGFGQVFLNIARRSQTLLHRQLALLDGIERRVTDPDDLEELFRIDHLATRMRRHAEDLVILAGAAPGRGWRNPVPIADVLRAAASEVEEYARISVVNLPELELLGRAVNDVVHLLAELLENATLFSPPDTQVSISAQLVPHGFAVEIEDRGLGMTAEAIDEANRRLTRPPDFDPANSSRLGLFVVSRLAARHGIRVELRRSPFGGVTAVVLIPSELAVAPGELPSTPGATPFLPRPRRPIPVPVSPAGPVGPALDTPHRPELITGGPMVPPAAPGLTADGLPQRIRTDRVDAAAAANGSTMPMNGEPAPAGLYGSPTTYPTTGPLGGAVPVGGSYGGQSAPRSPEQMRSMLSSFQHGTILGRRDAVVSADAEVTEFDPHDVTDEIPTPVQWQPWQHTAAGQYQEGHND